MRWAMWILLALMVPGVARAQTSPAQRAQQLAKLEEDLNSPDPNLRLATLEWAMESRSIAIRTKAMAVALSSSDAQMNAVGLRYKVCGTTQMLVRNGYPTPTNHLNVFNGFRGGQTVFQVKSCDPLSGVGTISYTNNYSGAIEEGHFQVRDRSLVVRFRSANSSCSAILVWQGGQQMAGQLSCPNSLGSFGPVEARFSLD